MFLFFENMKHGNSLISVVHPIDPVFDEDSKILILGSFPSVKSREVNFFYGHKQNRFWKLMEKIYDVEPQESIEEKKNFLHEKHIALWDVIHSCKIEGSSDASISDVVPNDLNVILNCSKAERIYVNGKTAEKMYVRYIKDQIGRDCIVLPSTSPANAAYSFEKLYEVWKQIKEV